MAKFTNKWGMGSLLFTNIIDKLIGGSGNSIEPTTYLGIVPYRVDLRYGTIRKRAKKVG
jgi:hypothetical protein